LEGNKVLEIKPAGLHKGTAAARWLGTEHPDFILAMGDDHTDEDLFGVLPPAAYTVKVGSAPRSLARYFIPGPAEVRQLLRKLHQAKVEVPVNS
jgi:trehalose 6-phosphate synthase/phosphatase